MADKPTPGVIGARPRTRPHRRSDTRAAPLGGAPPVDGQSAKPAAAPKPRAVKPAAAPKPRAAKPAAAPKPRAAKAAAAPKRSPAAKPRAATPAATAPPAATPAPPARPAPEPSPGVLETAVQAAAELTEIGLHAGARALRRAVSRLPRP
ncbi:MAG: hypothetical protein ACXVE8_17315 [Solirubrobacteraceae bacterium]